MKNIKALIGGLALAAIGGVNGYMAIGPYSIQLPGCKRRGIKSVIQCCSGGGDCIVSQSTNCNDW